MAEIGRKCFAGQQLKFAVRGWAFISLNLFAAHHQSGVFCEQLLGSIHLCVLGQVPALKRAAATGEVCAMRSRLPAGNSSRTTRPSAVVILAAMGALLTGPGVAPSAASTFQIQSASSTLQLTQVGQTTFSAQHPGSLQSVLSGTLEVDLSVAGVIKFTGGAIHLANSGVAEPLAAPAVFGAVARITVPPGIPLYDEYDAWRGLALAPLVGQFSVQGGSFPLQGFSLKATAGMIDVGVAFNLDGNVSYLDSFDLTGSVFQSYQAGSGQIQSGAGGMKTLTIPMSTVWSSGNGQAYLTGTLVATYSPPPMLVGDANGDCSVGAADYALWAAQFGITSVGLSADFDGNGSVGAGDYALWAANFGNSCVFPAAAVPEPASAMLLACGAMLVLAGRVNVSLRKVNRACLSEDIEDARKVSRLRRTRAPVADHEGRV